MLSVIKTACSLTLAAALAALPFSAMAQPVPGAGNVPPPSGGPTGCYNVTSGLPEGYQMSFCLENDHDGTYRLAGPGVSCEERLDYQDRRDGAVHIELVLAVCGIADNVLTDDLNCLLVAPGIACTFDRERGLDPGTIIGTRIY